MIDLLSDQEYRQLPYESFSSLKYLLESPEAYFYNKQSPFKGNDSTLLGTAIHHYLQGNSHLVAISPVDKRKKKEYEKFTQSLAELNPPPETIIVPLSFKEKLEKIQENIQKDEKVRDLLEGCVFEIPKMRDKDGINVKGKADAYHSTLNRVIEIKTSYSAINRILFREEAVTRHYDLQAAMYCWLYGSKDTLTDHYFIVVNTDAPYKISIYQSGMGFLHSGVQKYIKVLNEYKKYIINKESLSDEIQEI